MNLNLIQKTPIIIATVTSLAICVIPFSVAAANILFATGLLFSILSGHWWKGVKVLTQFANTLTMTWLAYMALMILGLLWTIDLPRGLIIISKQWSWLIIPMLLTICQDKVWSKRLMLSLSIGLGTHLLLCIAQSQGIPLPVSPPGGSSTDDPAGLIGHISFGLLYSIWAAWLIHKSMTIKGYTRYLLWVIAFITVIMIFIVQGRSGYLVTFAITTTLIWKLWLKHLNFKVLTTMVLLAIVASLTVAMGPAKERISWTLNSLQSFQKGDFKHAEARISMWYAAWEAWNENPILGVGTGGFRNISSTIFLKNPELNFDGKNYTDHPHQMYLLDLARWGPIGLLLLILLLTQWIRLGQTNWIETNQILIPLSGIGLAFHGLTAPSLEEYHASIYAAIFFAIGLAAKSYRLNKK